MPARACSKTCRAAGTLAHDERCVRRACSLVPSPRRQSRMSPAPGRRGVRAERSSSLPSGELGACTGSSRGGGCRASVNAGPAPQQGQQGQRPPFDLALAVTLAGCAFDAYNDPPAGAGYVETSANGTRTTILDRQYLQSRLKGVLRVHLQSATNLNAADPWGSSDPYCVLALGDASHTSKVLPRTLQPTWDERCELLVRDPATQRLSIRVVDKDYVTSDDALGSTLLPLATLEPGKRRQLNLQLVGGGDGRVQLQVELVPLEDMATSAEEMVGGLQGTLPHASDVPRPWRLLAQLSGAAGLEHLEPVAFIDNTDTDTQLWVLVNRQLRHVCIAWRGTEQTKIKDLLTDISFAPSALGPERVAGSSDTLPGDGLGGTLGSLIGGMFNKAVEGAGGAGTSGGKAIAASATARALRMAKSVIAASSTSEQPLVHGGFLAAYDSVHSRAISLVEELTAGGAPGEWTVSVTGHSLGGALATLSAYELACHRFKLGGAPAVQMSVFGSPRVGNVAFARQFDAAVPAAWRVCNTRDIVTAIPRLMGYCHVGGTVRLSAAGKLLVDDSRMPGGGGDGGGGGGGGSTGGSGSVGTAEAAGGEDAGALIGEGALSGEGALIGEDAGALIGEGARLEAVALAIAEQLLLEEDPDARMAAVMELVQQEMEIMATIFDGSALEHHLEDVYLDSIKALVVADLGLAPELVADIKLGGGKGRSIGQRSPS